jgi:hypothetical protein
MSIAMTTTLLMLSVNRDGRGALTGDSKHRLGVGKAGRLCIRSTFLPIRHESRRRRAEGERGEHTPLG